MKLADVTQLLRDAFRMYNALPEEEKKAERSELYKAQGNFGKLVIQMAGPFTELEAKVHAKQESKNE